jgi:neutral ceramidase
LLLEILMRNRKEIVLIVFFLSLCLKTAVAEFEHSVMVGVAKVDVTPTSPVVLAGYGGRTTEYDGIDTKLWARAMVIGDAHLVAIVVLDNCGIPAKVKSQLAKRLSGRGISPDRIIVAATHTHNAPTLVGYANVVWAGRTTPAQEQRVAEYTLLAIAKMEQAVVTAIGNREPMQLEWAQGRVNFGGNRRVLTAAGQWSGFGFQRNGPVDHSLPILAARDAKGRVRAVWANYACHCTTTGSANRIGGDWAGFANTFMEADFPNAVSLMTIGCGADIGPQPSGSIQLAAEHGRSVAQETKRLLSGQMKRIHEGPKVISRRIKLPLDDPPPRTYWDEQLRNKGFHHQLAKTMVSRLENDGKISSEVDYPISVWSFGDRLAMVFLAGEVVVDYSVRLNRELDWTKLWITAWSNDMPGYIPSNRVLAEGGYEADFSQVYYEQPARYSPEVEDVLVLAVKEMVGPTFAAAKDQPTAPFNKPPSGEAETFRRLAKWAASEKTDDEAAVLKIVRQLIPQASPAIGQLLPDGGRKTEWYNFAGDYTTRSFIRQQAKGTQLGWKTPAVIKRPARVTLCFTGGIGWESSPKADGFALLVDGEQKLEFDVTRSPSRWMSKDKSVELIYLPTWTSNEDSAGFFFVRLPTRAEKDDGVNTIAVRSLAENSKRWFAVDAKQDVRENLKLLSRALDTKP